MRNRAPTVVPSGRPMARWQAERRVERWAKSKGRTMPSQTGTALSREAHRRRDSARSSERCPTCPLPPLGPIPRASRARTAQPLIGQRAAPRSNFFLITNKRPSLPARAGICQWLRGIAVMNDGMWVLRRQMTGVEFGTLTRTSMVSARWCRGVSRGVEGCRVGRVGMGCRGVESVSRFGVEVSRPGLRRLVEAMHKRMRVDSVWLWAAAC